MNQVSPATTAAETRPVFTNEELVHLCAFLDVNPQPPVVEQEIANLLGYNYWWNRRNCPEGDYLAGLPGGLALYLKAQQVVDALERKFCTSF